MSNGLTVRLGIICVISNFILCSCNLKETAVVVNSLPKPVRIEIVDNETGYRDADITAQAGASATCTFQGTLGDVMKVTTNDGRVIMERRLSLIDPTSSYHRAGKWTTKGTFYFLITMKGVFPIPVRYI